MKKTAVSRARGPEGNLGYLFRLGYQAFRAALEHALRPHGLSVPQYGALSAFDAAPQMSSADLARLAAVTPQSMNTVVHQLGAAGLLEQCPHSGHGKTVLLRLSPAGRHLLDQTTPAVRAVEQDAFHGLSTQDTRVVRYWLATVIARFTANE